MSNVHGRAIERKMPTGMAWHGATLKAIYEAIGSEFQLLETDLNDRCNADNQLLGEGLSFWEKALGLSGTGTLADRQAAVKQRLGDSGGITITDITNALHEAGFTNLYAHPNYEYLDLTVEATPMGANTQMGADTQMSYAHIYTGIVDPRLFESFSPFETMGLTTQMGESTQMGAGSGAEGIVVNNLQDDSFAQIPANPAAWTGVFFVCAETKFETGTVPANQKEALKLLIQTIKTFNTAAILFVEYLVPGGIQITSPASSAEIVTGSNITITGTTDFADGETVTLYKTVGGIDTQIGSTVVTSGAFSYTWTASGDPGSITLKAVCNGIESEVTVTLLSALTVVAPTVNQNIPVDTAFSVNVETGEEGSVSVYVGSTLIATIPIVDGAAIGAAIIPQSAVGVGSAFIIEDGQEIPADDSASITLRFTDGAAEKTVNIYLTNISSDFIIGTAVGTMGFTADRTITGEFELKASGQVGYTPDKENAAEFVLDAEGSVTVTDS